MRHISREEYPTTPDQFRKQTSQNENRSTIIRHIVQSIITSEESYVECLNKMVKYMKAINATLTTSQPVITKEENQTIFFKIEDIYNVHNEFLKNLKSKISNEGDICVGDAFKFLVKLIKFYIQYKIQQMLFIF